MTSKPLPQSEPTPEPARPAAEPSASRPASPDGSTAPERRDEVAVSRTGERKPRLPHERDTSADSQTPHPEHEAIGEQAHDDLRRGLVDTGPAPVMEHVGRKL